MRKMNLSKRHRRTGGDCGLLTWQPEPSGKNVVIRKKRVTG